VNNLPRPLPTSGTAGSRTLKSQADALTNTSSGHTGHGSSVITYSMFYSHLYSVFLGHRGSKVSYPNCFGYWFYNSLYYYVQNVIHKSTV